jgi:hypothetical protein
VSQPFAGGRAVTGTGPAGGVCLAVALAGCVLLAGCGGGARPATSAAGSPSPAAPAAVPWAALDPAYPTIPSHTVPARADPAAARTATPCRASDLRLTTRIDGAGGTAYLGVEVRPAGEHRCRLEGRPRVTVLDRGRPVDIPVVPTQGDDLTFNYPDPVLVAPGRTATLSLAWASDWCTTPLRTDEVRLDLPDGGGSVTVPGFPGTPGCTMRVEDLTPAQRHTTPLRVSTFAPQRFRGARVVSAYAGLRAHARRTSAPRPDHRLEFTVTLTARRDLVLDPCPDFTIEQYDGNPLDARGAGAAQRRPGALIRL